MGFALIEMNNKNQQTPYTYRYYRQSPRLPVYSSGPQKPRSSSYFKRLLVLACLIALAWGSVSLVSSHVKAHSLDQKKSGPTESLSTMDNTINSVIQSNSGVSFEVAVTDLNTGNQLNFGQTVPMAAASVEKLVTASYFLSQVEKGQESMSETLEDGNTASYDLQQMIVVSNDSAWESLNDQLGYNYLQEYANNLGLTSFDSTQNTLSASDTATLLDLLYHGKLLNSSNTKLLLSYMKQANYRDLIIPAVPSYDTIYHKVGEYNDNVNDASIITNGSQSIALVIFTNGNGLYNWTNRAVMMQQITKAVLAHYQLN